jgi:hypothetical protein
MIDVKRTASDDPTEFEVTVTEGSTRTRHRVTMADTTYRKLIERGPNHARDRRATVFVY